jgi:integrase
MPFTTWIRDLLGIRKDYVDTERSILEIERLEAEKRERTLITPATLEDIEKYDLKTRSIVSKGRTQTRTITLIIEILIVIAILLIIAAIRIDKKMMEKIKGTRESSSPTASPG